MLTAKSLYDCLLKLSNAFILKTVWFICVAILVVITITVYKRFVINSIIKVAKRIGFEQSKKQW